MKGKHEKLPELWVKGSSFDWRRLYGGAKRRRSRCRSIRSSGSAVVLKRR